MEEKRQITAEGLRKLEEELQELKIISRKDVAGKLKEAREQGDLSENAEYDAAKDEQRDIEARIGELEKIIRNAEVVETSEIDSRKVNVGSRVIVNVGRSTKDVEYRIVGASEADSLQGLISNESPVGSALIGHKKGDVVKAETPAGKISYKIIKVGRAK